MKLFLSSILLLTSLSLVAEPVTTCEQTLNVCIEAVNDAKNVIEVQNAAIQEARKQRDEAVTELSKASSPLLPGWAWAVIGAAAATTTIMLVK